MYEERWKMRKAVLLIVLTFNLFAINFVIGTPKGLDGVNPIVNLAIQKGYNRQVWDFLTRIEEADVDINVKNMFVKKYYSSNPKIKYFLKQDIKAKKEFENFIKKLNGDVSNSANDLSFNSVSLNGGGLGINFKKSDLVALQQESQSNNNSNFKTIINILKMNYKCPDDEVCMPFYLPTNPKTIMVRNPINNRVERKKVLTDFKYRKPDILFFEHFSPQKRGRRYFLNINIYVITIDSDGTPHIETEIVKDFNWKRNYRFIAAQSGAIIREIITKKAEVDIQ